MTDLQFAPPAQRLTAPPTSAPVIPPQPPAPATVLKLTTPSVAQIRETTITSATKPLLPTYQELIQATADQAPQSSSRKIKNSNKRSKKPLVALLVLAALGGGGYYFRNSPQAQRLMGHEQQVAPLPTTPFVRPGVTSAEFTVVTSAVANGVPNKVTSKVVADYTKTTTQSTTDTQIGGVFTSSQEVRTSDAVFHPGAAFGSAWTRQPVVAETPGPYDTPEFLPMIDSVVDQSLRDHAKPTKSKSATVEGTTITSLTYVLDRSSVPEIAPAIFARTPWLFDVPNATTLTVEVSYDQGGLVRHLSLAVDPPQPGTGSDKTWVTSYTMDVASLNAPVTIAVPTDAVDAPVGTP